MAYIGQAPAVAVLTSAQIADNAITSAKIINSGITAEKIADGNVTSDKIADGTVIAADVLDHTITSQKMSNTGVAATTYGGTSAIPVFSVDIAGRITSIANTNITTGATLTLDETTDVEYKVGLANATTGAWTDAYVSANITYNPSTGTITAQNFNNISDENYKKDVATIQNATETVSQIEGVEFTWIGSEKKSAGFIAQRIEEVLPHLVNTNNEGMKSVNYSGIIAYLVETVKELDARVKELESRG